MPLMQLDLAYKQQKKLGCNSQALVNPYVLLYADIITINTPDINPM